MDKFFSSPDLLDDLPTRAINCCETDRNARRRGELTVRH
jgi:hypothetical protein